MFAREGWEWRQCPSQKFFDLAKTKRFCLFFVFLFVCFGGQAQLEDECKTIVVALKWAFHAAKFWLKYTIQSDNAHNSMFVKRSPFESGWFPSNFHFILCAQNVIQMNIFAHCDSNSTWNWGNNLYLLYVFGNEDIFLVFRHPVFFCVVLPLFKQEKLNWCALSRVQFAMFYASNWKKTQKDLTSLKNHLKELTKVSFLIRAVVLFLSQSYSITSVSRDRYTNWFLSKICLKTKS